jgi:hypothetical protein
MMQDILVFTPVYRLEAETITAVLALDYSGPISWLFQEDNPADGDTPEGGRRNILHQYQRGREIFLRGDYDAMLVVESDIIPPPNALTRLLALECDVAYGVYVFRQTENTINVFERYPQPARNTGESFSVWPHKLAQARAAGKVPCSGGGLGCILIQRRVLETIPFRGGIDGPHCDTHFTNDVYAAGFSMWADMTVVCGHKREDGVIVWPNGM